MKRRRRSLDVFGQATVVCVLAFFVGCTPAGDGDIDHEGTPMSNSDWVDEMIQFCKAPVELRIPRVRAADGGCLGPGEQGWIVIRLLNTSDQEIRVRTAGYLGKGAPARDHSLPLGPHALGVAVGQLTCEFLDAEGNVVTRQALAPPDDPVVLLPRTRESASWPPECARDLWRPVTAPEKAGIYTLRLHLDTQQAMRTICRTLNLAVRPAAPIPTIVAEVTADNIVISSGPESGDR
jgi:hypothetical protein